MPSIPKPKDIATIALLMPGNFGLPEASIEGSPLSNITQTFAFQQMLVIAPIIALLLCPALWLVFGRPRFLRDSSNRKTPAGISVIIPARNEEENLPKLLQSFRNSQNQPSEIIVVDDGSTDRTAEVAQAHGAKVVQPNPLPADWKGKPWACQEGARKASGDWYLFLDADVWLEPDGFDRIRPLANKSNEVTSICPYHRIKTLAEELSSFFNLIMVAGSNAFGLPRQTAQNSALFGQSLLISRKNYAKIGGHQKVKNEILENFHLAAHLKNEKIACRCFLGKGVLSMRMFPQGFSELCKSWKKGFTSGARQAETRALVLISLWLTAGMIILVSLLVLSLSPASSPPFPLVTALAYLLFALQCFWAFRQVGNFSIFNALLFPLSLIFYQIVFFTALLEKKRGIQTDWKGRDVG